MASKNIEKVAKEALKVMTESWTLYSPRSNKLTLDSFVGYGWAVSNTTDLQLE